MDTINTQIVSTFPMIIQTVRCVLTTYQYHPIALAKVTAFKLLPPDLQWNIRLQLSFAGNGIPYRFLKASGGNNRAFPSFHPENGGKESQEFIKMIDLGKELII